MPRALDNAAGDATRGGGWASGCKPRTASIGCLPSNLPPQGSMPKAWMRCSFSLRLASKVSVLSATPLNLDSRVNKEVHHVGPQILVECQMLSIARMVRPNPKTAHFTVVPRLPAGYPARAIIVSMAALVSPIPRDSGFGRCDHVRASFTGSGFRAGLAPSRSGRAGCSASWWKKPRRRPTPYPMTLNSLLAGSNQKSNRDPVLSLEEGQVEEALAAHAKGNARHPHHRQWQGR